MLRSGKSAALALGCAAFALATGVGPARAQVNVEALRRDLRDRPATASIGATFTGRTGNVRSIEAGGSALGAARVDRSTFLASVQADYGRFAGATTVSKSFLHLRYNYEHCSGSSPKRSCNSSRTSFNVCSCASLPGRVRASC